MFKRKSFIDLCIDGDVLMDEIDNAVEQWHNDPNTGDELSEYLGMTEKEYSIWATKPSIFPYIISARKNGISLESELDKEFKIAARSNNPANIKRIEAWLKQVGKH